VEDANEQSTTENNKQFEDPKTEDKSKGKKVS